MNLVSTCYHIFDGIRRLWPTEWNQFVTLLLKVDFKISWKLGMTCVMALFFDQAPHMMMIGALATRIFKEIILVQAISMVGMQEPRLT